MQYDRDSSLGIKIGYWLDGRGLRNRVPVDILSTSSRLFVGLI
jgi:hypothetical protein